MTSEKLLARALDLRPLLAANAAQSESDRRVPDESINALTEAGLFGLATPRRYGGSETDLRTLLDVGAAVGEADGAAAWVLGLINACAWITSLFPEKTQDEVFGAGPEVRISGALAPTAQADRVDGGYRVSGRWPYASGVWHTDWTLIGFPFADGEGAIALVPAADYEIDRTWFMVGMRGTGSDTPRAEGIFVPDHRVIGMTPAIDGALPTQQGFYGSAFVPVLTLILAAPSLGMARSALRFVQDKAAGRAINSTVYTAQSESVGFQMQLAEAAMKVDSAHLHAYRAADDIDTAAARGEYPDRLVRARIRADTTMATRYVVEAMDLLMSAHGTSSFAESNPLQQIWRDANIAYRHAMTLPAVNFEVYGKEMLGISPNITPLV
jgi:alkylation response protein AidB-like acyl-CoA dehydrogenase